MDRILTHVARTGHKATGPRRLTLRIGTIVFLVSLISVGFETAARAEGPFAIQDGDRVVFYGDSITDQRLYTTFVETYIVTRFPSMNVSFVHSGWGGDRVTGGGGGPIDRRLTRDVFAYKPTVVTVMLGMNDASYRPFKPVDLRCLRQGLSAPCPLAQEQPAGPEDHPDPTVPVRRRDSQADSSKADTTRCSSAMASSCVRSAEKEGAAIADLNTPVVAALKKAQEIDPTHAQDLIHDRVHPGPGGQLLMAEALLKAWNAPAVVSVVEIDAAAKKVPQGREHQDR